MSAPALSVLTGALHQALWVLLLAAAVPLLAAALCGALVDGLLRRLGVGDPALSRLGRLCAGLLALLLCGPVLFGRVVQLARALLEAVPRLTR